MQFLQLRALDDVSGCIRAGQGIVDRAQVKATQAIELSTGATTIASGAASTGMA